MTKNLITLPVLSTNLCHVKSLDGTLIASVRINVNKDTDEYKELMEVVKFVRHLEIQEIRPSITNDKASDVVFKIFDVESLENLLLFPPAQESLANDFIAYIKEKNINLNEIMDEGLDALAEESDKFGPFIGTLFQESLNSLNNETSLNESILANNIDGIEEFTETNINTLNENKVEEKEDDEESFSLEMTEEDYTIEDILFTAYYYYITHFEEDFSKEFQVEVPDAQIHALKMIFEAGHPAPFVLATEEQSEDISFSEVHQLCFMGANSQEYNESISLFDQKLTGLYNLSITGESMNTQRGKVMNIILRLAEGDNRTLLETLRIINEISVANEKFKRRRKGDFTARLSYEEQELYFFMEAVNRAWSFFAPKNIAAIIQEKEDTLEYLQSIEELDSLFEDTDMSKAFDDIIETYQKENLMFLTPPKAEASAGEILRYYSAKLTKSNFPEAMRPLLRNIEDFDVLYNNDWVGGIVDSEKLEEKLGETVIAKLITVALQMARLEEIINNTNTNINPIGCLVRSMSSPEESLFWVHSEGLLSIVDKEDTVIFEKVFGTGIGLGEVFDVPTLMSTSFSFLLHRIGHSVMDTNTLDSIELLATDLPVPATFFEEIKNFMETEESQNSFNTDLIEEVCPPHFASISLFNQINSAEDILEATRQFGVFLIEYAKTQIITATTGKETEKEYKEIMREFLMSLLMPSQLD